jgi:hypothetical protein
MGNYVKDKCVKGLLYILSSTALNCSQLMFVGIDINFGSSLPLFLAYNKGDFRGDQSLPAMCLQGLL